MELNQDISHWIRLISSVIIIYLFKSDFLGSVSSKYLYITPVYMFIIKQVNNKQ